MLKYFQRKRERERERERENASAFRALSKRGERERTRRGIKNVSSLAKRAKEGVVLVHTCPFFIAFSGEKRKNSLSSRFSVALTDISLITIGLFQYSLFLRAREHKAGASEKKTRANAVSTHGKRVLSRENCTRARRVPFAFPSFTLKNKIKHTPTPHHREKSLHELTFCLSVKEKNENAKSKSSLEIHPQKPTRDA